MNVRLNHFVQRTLLVTCLGLGICIIFVLLVLSMSFLFIGYLLIFVYHCFTCVFRIQVIKTQSLQW